MADQVLTAGAHVDTTVPPRVETLAAPASRGSVCHPESTGEAELSTLKTDTNVKSPPAARRWMKTNEQLMGEAFLSKHKSQTQGSKSKQRGIDRGQIEERG